MPPLLAHDPLDAAQQAARPGAWLAPATALSVACEHWALALVALATYAWLERDVPAVLRAFLPLLTALAVGVGIVAACARAGSLAGWGVGAVPSGHALWAATFAAYTLLAYGPRVGLAALGLALSGGAARLLLGANGIPSVAAGWAVGAALGYGAFAGAARWLPGSRPHAVSLRRHGAGKTEERDVTP